MPAPWLILALGVALFGYSKKDVVMNEITTQKSSFTRWDGLFKAYGARHKVPWQWLKAICMNESSLGEHPRVARGLAAPWDVAGSRSEDGKSWGLMQLTIPTARDIQPEAIPEKLNDPEYSISIAARLVAWLMKRFELSDPRYLEWVIKSYNQGVGNTNKERISKRPGEYKEAQDYWERFQRNLALVQSKQGKE